MKVDRFRIDPETMDPDLLGRTTEIDQALLRRRPFSEEPRTLTKESGVVVTAGQVPAIERCDQRDLEMPRQSLGERGPVSEVCVKEPHSVPAAGLLMQRIKA